MAQLSERQACTMRSPGASSRWRPAIWPSKSVKVPPTSIGKVADQIEYVRRVAGVEHIGLGGDFDGNTEWPEGLSDVSMYPNLFAELIHRGWTDKDLKLLAGENVLRVLGQAERVSAEMKRR